MVSMELSDFVALIRENPLMVASTVSPAGKAESAMVEGVITEKGTVIYASLRRTRKVDNLAKNPSVALFAWNASKLLSAQIDGNGALVDESHQAWAEELFFSAFPEKQGNPNQVLIAVKPYWARMVDISAGLPPKVDELTISAGH